MVARIVLLTCLSIWAVAGTRKAALVPVMGIRLRRFALAAASQCGRCGSNRCSTWACVVEMGNVGVAGWNGACRCHVSIGEGVRDKRCSQDDSEKVVMHQCGLFPYVTSVPRCPQGLCLCACE